MAKRKLSAGITDLGAGRYRIRVSGGYNPVTGDRIVFDRTIRDSVAADAENVRAGFILQIGGTVDAKTLKLSVFFETMWFPHLEGLLAQGKIRRSTIKGYCSKVDNHIVPTFGNVVIGKLRPYMLDCWLAALASPGAGRYERPLGQGSRHHCYRVFHTAMEQAVMWELLADNPLDKVEDPGVPDFEPIVLSETEANKVLDAFRGHELEPVVIIALAAGLRESELAALTWADVRLRTLKAEDGTKTDVGEVDIHRGLHQDNRELYFEPNKTKRSKRVVALPQWAAHDLKALRSFGPLAPYSGGLMAPDMMSARFRARLKKLKLKDVPLKDLRHTNATLALENGVDVVILSRRLGHSNVTTTDRFYLRPGSAADEDAARKTNGWRSTHGDTKGASTQRDAQG